MKFDTKLVKERSRTGLKNTHGFWTISRTYSNVTTLPLPFGVNKKRAKVFFLISILFSGFLITQKIIKPILFYNMYQMVSTHLKLHVFSKMWWNRQFLAKLWTTFCKKKSIKKSLKILVKNPATQNFQKYISLRPQKLVKMCSNCFSKFMHFFAFRTHDFCVLRYFLTKKF